MLITYIHFNLYARYRSHLKKMLIIFQRHGINIVDIFLFRAIIVVQLTMKGELGYLKLVRNVLQKQYTSPNRTGTPTLSIFGAQMRFDLRNKTLPMMTTKFVSFDHVAKELLWFMRGDTNQKNLERAGVSIWKANATREFLDSRGLHHYKENETLGPIYGFQWRHFNAKYIDANTDYSNQGFDQLKHVIETIKKDPSSRRIIMSAWNASCINEMALPPCHVLVQFYVDTLTNELSSHLYQRSGDLMLGVPYNITSYSLLTHIIARICGLKTGEFVHSIGDVHIYEDHIPNAKIQVERLPLPPPTLEISNKMSLDVDDIDIRDFQIQNYKFYPKLAYKMAV